jgi:hypothetical protein
MHDRPTAGRATGDPYTGAPIGTEQRVDIAAGLAGSALGVYQASTNGGWEWAGKSKNWRFAPFGNRTMGKSNPGEFCREMPHYHMRRPGGGTPGPGHRTSPSVGIIANRHIGLGSFLAAGCVAEELP